MPTRVNDRRRRRLTHFARCFADHIGPNTRLQEYPLRCVLPHVVNQLLETDGVALDVVLVVELLVDDDIHPAEQQRNVGTGPDREPVLGLAGRDREAWVDGDQRRVVVDRVRERLYLSVVQVFANVRTQ